MLRAVYYVLYCFIIFYMQHAYSYYYTESYWSRPNGDPPIANDTEILAHNKPVTEHVGHSDVCLYEWLA